MPPIVAQPARRRLDGDAARHGVNDPSDRVEDDDLRNVAAHPARRDDVVAGVRPARLGPLLVVRARGERRDPLAVARHAHEARGARDDLLGDDLAVGAGVGAGETLPEGQSVVVLAALNPQVGALSVRIGEVDLRVEILAVAERDVGGAAIAPADARATAIEVDAKGAKGFAAGRAAVDERRIGDPTGSEHEHAVVRELTPTGERRDGRHAHRSARRNR